MKKFAVIILLSIGISFAVCAQNSAGTANKNTALRCLKLAENCLVAGDWQNALNQARAFKEVTDGDGIILTKLDGTAKGGVVLSVQMELGLPVVYAGTGEKLQDLEKFDAHSFVAKMFEDEE